MYRMDRLVLWSCLLPLCLAGRKDLNGNPDPNFDPRTSTGTLGPFVIPQQPAPGATGGPPVGSLDARTIQAMQLAASNWFTDTGIVTLFQNNGPITTDEDQFRGIADGAFKAEVDELTQKAVLDQVIGNDPRVSLANLTLTNGVFQSVVDNLQIMSLQGQARSSLISTINAVRCTQILPAIDTYFLVAAEYIGDNAQQRRAIRPNACAQVLAGASSALFATLPGTPAGTPPGIGDGNISGIPDACGQGNTIPIVANGTVSLPNGSPAMAPRPLDQITTPQLDLPGFPGNPQIDPAPVSNGKPRIPQVGSAPVARSRTSCGNKVPGSNSYSGSLHGHYGDFRRT